MKLNYFNFKEFGDRVLMTNDFGQYIFVSKEEFEEHIKNNDFLEYATYNDNYY